MRKSKGILIWGIDYDKMANAVGEKLDFDNPKNVSVVKYNGPLDYSMEELEEMSNRAAKNPFTTFPDIKAYADSRDDWILKKILSYPKKERKWAVELHSTEHDKYEPEDPSWDYKQIYLVISSHNRNSKMKKIIDEKYRQIYGQQFPGNDFDWDMTIQQYPSLVTVELFHYPKYQEVKKAEKIVRSLLDYLSTNY